MLCLFFCPVDQFRSCLRRPILPVAGYCLSQFRLAVPRLVAGGPLSLFFPAARFLGNGGLPGFRLLTLFSQTACLPGTGLPTPIRSCLGRGAYCRGTERLLHSGTRLIFCLFLRPVDQLRSLLRYLVLPTAGHCLPQFRPAVLRLDAGGPLCIPFPAAGFPGSGRRPGFRLLSFFSQAVGLPGTGLFAPVRNRLGWGMGCCGPGRLLRPAAVCLQSAAHRLLNQAGKLTRGRLSAAGFSALLRRPLQGRGCPGGLEPLPMLFQSLPAALAQHVRQQNAACGTVRRRLLSLLRRGIAGMDLLPLGGPAPGAGRCGGRAGQGQTLGRGQGAHRSFSLPRHLPGLRRAAPCGSRRPAGCFGSRVLRQGLSGPGLHHQPVGNLPALLQLPLKDPHPLQNPLLCPGLGGFGRGRFFCFDLGRGIHLDLDIQMDLRGRGCPFLLRLILQQGQRHLGVKAGGELGALYDRLIEDLGEQAERGQAQTFLPHHRHIRSCHRNLLDVVSHQQHPL